jgi:hypothetical protein
VALRNWGPWVVAHPAPANRRAWRHARPVSGSTGSGTLEPDPGETYETHRQFQWGEATRKLETWALDLFLSVYLKRLNERRGLRATGVCTLKTGYPAYKL